MINTREIKAQIKRAGTTQEKLARAINMDPSTLNRKINNDNGEKITVSEAMAIAEELSIPRDLLTDIFFAKELA